MTTTETSYQVQCGQVAAIHNLSVDAFANHTIETVTEVDVVRHYKCSKNGSSIYMFNVTTFPGHLVVSGDIGDMMWARCHDMFQWAPNAIKSIDYFEEKVPHGIETREFDKDTARARLYECLEGLEQPELGETLEKVQDCERYIDDGEHFFQAKVWEESLFDGCDWPDFTVFNGRFLWCREALLWFFNQRGMMATRIDTP